MSVIVPETPYEPPYDTPMREQPQLQSSLPANLRQIALILRLTGWVTFWVQLVIGVASLVCVAGFAVLGRNPQAQNNATAQGTGFGVFFAICGLVTLGIGIFLAFRYTRVSRNLRDPRVGNKPSKAYTLQLIRIGLMVNLLGMFFTIIGAEAIAGTILVQALQAPQGGSIFEARRFLQPLDILAVQANINTIVAHFVGILAAFWLQSKVNR